MNMKLFERIEEEISKRLDIKVGVRNIQKYQYKPEKLRLFAFWN